jgi:5-aminopentanamidase
MRIASVQCHVAFNDPAANAAAAVERLRELKSYEVDLAVFPEAFLTGYCVECVEDARQISIEGTHDALATIRQAAEEFDMVVVVGYAERTGDTVRNAAVLFEPGREPQVYYKTHLPELGLDRFVERGDDLPVFETRLGRIGMLICFDVRHPEPARVLALKGADVIVLPTNWPRGAEISADVLAVARAAENRVFVATCNRVGEEHGFHFIGRSKIVHPSGRVLAAAQGDEETVLYADIDIEEARSKRTVTIPGRHETTVFLSRHPALYGVLSHEGEPAGAADSSAL